ncbi:MAG: thioredoxin-dependent thiol peroxidase [Actinomycetota bacterium]|nr:thioredoxin-dependent thiol peroxidase [Actinomycetota bacterium]
MKLEPGMRIPDFTRQDDTGTNRSYDDFNGKGLVVYFYPKAFTPGCTGESCDFRDNHDRFIKAGYEVIGVSPDPTNRLTDFRNKYDLPFRLLSDEDHSMATAFGAWGLKKNYGKEYEGLIRSTFVIDAAGVVEHAWYNVRAKGHVGRVTGAVLEG